MRIFWTSPALAQLDEIQDYVAQESPRAAYELVNELIDRTERLLARNPRAGRLGRVSGTRELVLSKTSYIVVYRVNDDVDVLAVVHAAREWPEEFG